MAGLNLTPKTPEPAPVPEVLEEASSPEQTVEYEPVLLTQLQDDLARSRLREAFWISLVVHLVLLIVAYTSPRWMPKPPAVLVSTEDMLHDKELTYLEMPTDRAPTVKPQSSNIISDKDRRSMSPKPTLDDRALRQLRDSRVAPPAPPQPQQQATQQGEQQQPSSQQPAPQQTQTAQNTNPNALQMQQLQRQPEQKQNPFAMQGTAGSAIQQAVRSGGRSGFTAGSGMPSFGAGVGGSKVFGNVEVLSDTMGVDFDPYLRRVVNDVRMNWYTLIPESAMPPFLKKGNVMIEFVILQNGSVSGMNIVQGFSSGDIALDRAAWGGISKSNPFQPLPKEFKGPYLRLRFRFFYNPEKGDIQ